MSTLDLVLFRWHQEAGSMNESEVESFQDLLCWSILRILLGSTICKDSVRKNGVFRKQSTFNLSEIRMFHLLKNPPVPRPQNKALLYFSGLFIEPSSLQGRKGAFWGELKGSFCSIPAKGTLVGSMPDVSLQRLTTVGFFGTWGMRRFFSCSNV